MTTIDEKRQAAEEFRKWEIEFSAESRRMTQEFNKMMAARKAERALRLAKVAEVFELPSNAKLAYRFSSFSVAIPGPVTGNPIWRNIRDAHIPIRE
jgi:hypothetical protein